MQEIVALIDQYMIFLVIGLMGVVILLIILFIINTKKMNKVIKRYEKFMTKEEVDLEDLLIHYAKKVNKVRENQDILITDVQQLQKQIRTCTQKVGVIRYNAIENVGADLSFAIAILDSNDNGVVLNGIYSRNGSYTYAKPIIAGESSYTLSDEERQAIKKAQEESNIEYTLLER